MQHTHITVCTNFYCIHKYDVYIIMYVIIIDNGLAIKPIIHMQKNY